MAERSIIGASAAAYTCGRSAQKPEANIRRHDCRLPCRLHRSFSDFHSPWCGAACWACAQAKVALKVKDTSPVFRQWDTQTSPAGVTRKHTEFHASIMVAIGTDLCRNRPIPKAQNPCTCPDTDYKNGGLHHTSSWLRLFSVAQRSTGLLLPSIRHK